MDIDIRREVFISREMGFVPYLNGLERMRITGE